MSDRLWVVRNTAAEDGLRKLVCTVGRLLTFLFSALEVKALPRQTRALWRSQ
jgi:hypothetical protein